ncbi:hypothetical protein [Tenacibaculum discolor]|uniref:Uncharacterized protein n=1 Tax=Tenacibaculum discolor TaxID=361581 RepID=A0A2G1BRW1_9FLAO|nr:hypothetical protein [Tenacibaculum discolor]MDP2541879.1 hypothetical protein [Tenacibaculum discolor]PHN96803.1 hypothetical protein CSC81_12650 [Tenacibaculum discolor]PHO00417.1 hypothetical protein CSC82_28975 [Rhodobacteraceae bacterium 4F10]
MEVIKIAFFVLGVFFGENSRIGAEKTTVTINPNEQTIIIVQENIFALIANEADSMQVSSELKKVVARNWRKEIESYPSKSCTLYVTDEGSLNAKITLKYPSENVLRDFALDFNEEAKEFSLINIPDWNVETEDGALKGNYWRFSANNSFTFVVTPFKNMPDRFKGVKRSLLPIWESEKKN